MGLFKAVKDLVLSSFNVVLNEEIRSRVTRIRVIDGNIPVYHEDSVINAKLGWCPVPNALALRVPLIGTYMVIVNDAFTKASPDIQESLLAHEMGHIKSGHLETLAAKGFAANRNYRQDRQNGDRLLLDMELEADAYASANGHNMLEALYALQEQAKEYGLVISPEELQERLDALT